MNPPQLLIKWNLFFEKVYGNFNNLKFTDVTLVSDDLEKFPAHKFVLSASSPVLKEILLQNPHHHPVIFLNGLKREELKCLLQLMYYGEVRLELENMEKLIVVIKELKLNGFTFPSKNKATMHLISSSRMMKKIMMMMTL